MLRAISPSAPKPEEKQVMASATDPEKGAVEGYHPEELRVSNGDVKYETEDGMARQISTGGKHASLEWTDVSYTVLGGKKQILNGLSGALYPGQITCILGPSGAGKTSLLNFLSGRKTAGANESFGGVVSMNGRPVVPNAHKQKLAYVMQHDSLYATATPRNALDMSARLRGITDRAKREAKVLDIMETLGITGCADGLIGSEMIKGISGGEKKRVAIGCELVTNPEMIFLDEPTSGLDSHTAYVVCGLLRQLARTGRSVCCTVHQPSSEIFQLFDNAIFLAKGQVIYQGPVQEIVEYFKNAGHPVPAQYNPADWVMFLIQTLSEEKLDALFKLWATGNTSQLGTMMSVIAERRGSVEKPELPPARKRAPCGAQFGALLTREWQNLVRDKGSLIARFGITIFLNLIYGLVFQGVGDTTSADYDYMAHFGGVTMVSIGAMFGAAQPTLLTFPMERPVFLREYCSGLYSVLPYFLSKTLVEVPLVFLQSLVTVGVTHPLMNLHCNFFLQACCLCALSLVSASSALAVSCFVRDIKVAQEAAPVLFVPQILFAGFFIKLSLMPVFMRWIQYLCALKYAINLVLILEFGSSADPILVAHPSGRGMVDVGELVLDRNDIEEDNLWMYLMILAALFVGFRCLAVLGLKKRAKTVF